MSLNEKLLRHHNPLSFAWLMFPFYDIPRVRDEKASLLNLICNIHSFLRNFQKTLLLNLLSLYALLGRCNLLNEWCDWRRHGDVTPRWSVHKSEDLSRASAEAYADYGKRFVD